MVSVEVAIVFFFNFQCFPKDYCFKVCHFREDFGAADVNVTTSLIMFRHR
jgi:hypothetical protein